jgi:hypothetical protein
MASIDKRDGGPLQAGAAALFHFPDVFLKLRDEYMYSLIRKIAEEEPQPPVNPDQPQPEPISSIDVYLGHMHVAPVAKLWESH